MTEQLEAVFAIITAGSALTAAVFSVKVWFLLGKHEQGMEDLEKRVNKLERKVFT